MSKNKLYNQSYFVKRLLDAGFFVTRFNVKFESNDDRKWMILVNAKDSQYRHNIIVICFKDEATKDCQFKFQGFNTRDILIKTKSMNIIISLLRKTFLEDESQNEDSLSEIEDEEQV